MTHIQFRRFPILIAAAMTVLALLPSTAAAQLNGQNIKGDVGLKAGSQAPPGAYVSVPLWFYTADAVQDRNGDEILTGTLDSAIFGVAFAVVTQKRIPGGTYGFLAALPWANGRVQGASNNTGLGMVGQELLFGTTVYLNKQRSLHAATVATFDFFSEKKDSETKVGNILNLEGGFGADFLKGGLTAGLDYYGTLKLTDDRFDSRLVLRLIRDRNRMLAFPLRPIRIPPP